METVKRTVRVRAPEAKVWERIGDIAGLRAWVLGVRETVYLSERRRGVGTVRLLTFENGDRVEEHVVLWRDGESFTYVATEGLPLRAYVATISIGPDLPGLTRITWQSYMSSKEMTEEQFLSFVSSMGSFYEESLENLKRLLEG